jgi:hypothetical protein
MRGKEKGGSASWDIRCVFVLPFYWVLDVDGDCLASSNGI